MSDNIGRIMDALGATEGALRVAGGWESSNKKNAYSETYQEPIVIYRGRKDIGKAENKYGRGPYDDVREYIGNVNEYSYENLARDLKYNDMNDADIIKLNSKIGEPGAAVAKFIEGYTGSLVFNANSYYDSQPAIFPVNRSEAYITTSEEQMWSDLRSLAICARAYGYFLTFIKNTNTMMSCFWEMCRRFKEEHGATWEHREGPLHDAVYEHRTTKTFVATVIPLFLRKIFSPEINGDLRKLEFQTEWRQYERSGNYEDSNVYNVTDKVISSLNLYQLLQEFCNHPVFDDFTDKFMGLGITIHDIWAIKIQVENFVALRSSEGNIIGCKGTLVVMIYDNFGLDDGDIQQFPGDTYFPFWGWYILQHHKKFNGKYKPFINQIILAYDIGRHVDELANVYFGEENGDGYMIKR